MNNIFPDLVFACHLKTSRQFMASVFGIIMEFHEKYFPDLVWAVHLETSCQFVASVFGVPLVVRIHGNLLHVVKSLVYIVTTQTCTI